MGILALLAAICSAVISAISGVSTMAGATQLSNTPSCASSLAAALVKAMTPALAAE
ncbi:hypothetical protein D3C81_2296180 [compost metagenome]